MQPRPIVRQFDPDEHGIAIASLHDTSQVEQKGTASISGPTSTTVALAKPGMLCDTRGKVSVARVGARARSRYESGGTTSANLSLPNRSSLPQGI